MLFRDFFGRSVVECPSKQLGQSASTQYTQACADIRRMFKEWLPHRSRQFSYSVSVDEYFCASVAAYNGPMEQPTITTSQPCYGLPFHTTAPLTSRRSSFLPRVGTSLLELSLLACQLLTYHTLSHSCERGTYHSHSLKTIRSPVSCPPFPYLPPGITPLPHPSRAPLSLLA